MSSKILENRKRVVSRILGIEDEHNPSPLLKNLKKPASAPVRKTKALQLTPLRASKKKPASAPARIEVRQNVKLNITKLPNDLKRLILKNFVNMHPNNFLFINLKTFLFSLSDEVEQNRKLINNINDAFSVYYKKKIVKGIRRFFKDEQVEPSEQKKCFDGYFSNAYTAKFIKIIKTCIRNIYWYLLNPSTRKSKSLEIEYLSHSNIHINYFKNTDLLLKIREHLVSFINNYKPKLDDRLVGYILNIIDDVIDERYVAKFPTDRSSNSSSDDRSSDDRKLRDEDTLYENYYYMLLDAIEGRNILVKEGRHVGHDDPKPSKKFVVAGENPNNNFTHEECKTWAIMPIFNPRTFEPILIDSPLYNRLLLMSYKYDRSLIPRMITSRGYSVIWRVLYAYYDDYSDDT
jgi:hypothetical protein